MRYQITHTIDYNYDRPVIFNPHVLRLRPRCNGEHQLHAFDLEVKPQPAGMTPILDAAGNAIARCWWLPVPAAKLQLRVTAEVETFCTNPFNYLLEPWALKFPLDYPASLLQMLQPYLASNPLNPVGFDPVAVQLGQELAHRHPESLVCLLSDLNQQIYSECEYQLRETGDPLLPGITWTQKSGSCRDLCVLFIAVCQSLGLAARFVSGYHEGDPAQEQHLHAWAEVYLPGAGWRGYDPTLGLVVGDRHIPLAASSRPGDAAPVSGSIQGNGVQMQLSYQLLIQPI